jgi:radical SAM protein with 4Fe4S-binding SPASM domain
LLSIDGNKEVQDFNRPCRNGGSSFDLVQKNIPLLLDAFPNTTFRSTIYQPTCDKLFDTYIFAIQNNFKSIFMCPNARETWTEENVEKLKIEIHKIFTFIETCFRLNVGMPIASGQINKTFQHILEHDIGVVNHISPELYINRGVVRCGLGTGSASIAYNGLIFGCQEQDSRDTNDYFYIGDIFNGVNKERHKKLLSDYATLAAIECEDKNLCSNCKLRKTCKHEVCPSVSHDLFDSFFIKPKIDCILGQTMYDDAL